MDKKNITKKINVIEETLDSCTSEIDTYLISIVADSISDLLENFEINERVFLKDYFYEWLIKECETAPIDKNIVISVKTKQKLTPEEKIKFNDCHQRCFIESTIHAIKRRKEYVKTTRLMFIILLFSIVGIFGMLVLMNWYDQYSESASKFLVQGILGVCEEMLFLVLWIMGWNCIERICFDLPKMSQKIANRYLLYKAKIFYSSNISKSAKRNIEINNKYSYIIKKIMKAENKKKK